MKEELKNTDAHKKEAIPEEYKEVAYLLRQVSEKTKAYHNDGLKMGVFSLAYLRHESGAINVNASLGYSSMEDMCISIKRFLVGEMKENSLFVQTLFFLLAEQMGQDCVQGVLDAMKRLNFKKGDMPS